MTPRDRALSSLGTVILMVTTPVIARADPPVSDGGEASLLVGRLPVRPAPAAIFEAEDALVRGGSVASDHGGFTGRGFVDFARTRGAYIEWVIDAPEAGRAEINIRYANDSRHERPVEVTLNGEPSDTLWFANTRSWNTWFRATYTPLLAAGRNRIRLTTTSAHGGPNIDSIDAVLTMHTVDYQAEDAVISQAVVENEHGGYTGRGYVNTQNMIGSYVEWTVDVPAAGWYAVGWVTANATNQDRTTTLTINGDVVTTEWLFRSITGSWSRWTDSALTVPLAAGANSIRLTSNTPDGGPNYDRLLLYVDP